VSIGVDTSTDFQDDIAVPVGTDLSYIFSVQPLDVTGCTATFVTLFGTFPVALSVAVEGDQSVSQFTVAIPNASLPAAGVYTWRMLVTWPFSPSVTLQYGHGGIYVRST
jgi:hypothetical protein